MLIFILLSDRKVKIGTYIYINMTDYMNVYICHYENGGGPRGAADLACQNKNGGL